jgi:PAS domain S-box-containing protein
MQSDAEIAASVAAGADPTDEQFRLLVESVSDYAIYLIDARGRVASWNAGAARIKGYAAGEVLGRHFSLFYPSEDRAAGMPERALREAQAEGRFRAEGWRVRKDGTRFWADIVITCLRDRHGEMRGFAKVTRDMTERREALEQVHALTRRLVEAEESERKRIARELHDRAGQSLSALNINLDIVLADAGASLAPELQARLRDSLGLVEGTLQALENVMAELRPPLLDEYGLGAALGWHIEQVARRSNLAIALDDRAKERARELSPEAAVVLFRVAQEALNNVVKHAAAERVSVTLEIVEAHARLTIADDGRGFTPGPPDPRAPRWGVTTMRERVETVSGRIQVDSTPGRGTVLRAWAPLRAARR